MLFFLTAVALAIPSICFLRKTERIWIWICTGLFIFIISLFAAGIGSYSTCSDGWKSSSIGIQGACSHHGGVVVKLNEIGWYITGFDSFIFLCLYFYALYLDKKKEKEDREANNKNKS